MKVRFQKDYRSRSLMVRYAAGAVVDIDRADVLADVVGVYAQPVNAPTVEPEAAPEPPKAAKPKSTRERA